MTFQRLEYWPIIFANAIGNINGQHYSKKYLDGINQSACLCFMSDMIVSQCFFLKSRASLHIVTFPLNWHWKPRFWILRICRVYVNIFKLRWLSWFRKLRSSKKIDILQVALVLRVASWKALFFFHGGKKRCFSLIFFMKLSSAALSYLNAHSTFNFCKWQNLLPLN